MGGGGGGGAADDDGEEIQDPDSECIKALQKDTIVLY